MEWIGSGEALCVCGPSGTGKSHLVEALGHLAIDQGTVGSRARTHRATALVTSLRGGRATRFVTPLRDPALEWAVSFHGRCLARFVGRKDSSPCLRAGRAQAEAVDTAEVTVTNLLQIAVTVAGPRDAIGELGRHADRVAASLIPRSARMPAA